MFRHIFLYRLKCLSRNRMLVFWTFLYPMVMATLFSLAFANLYGSDAFTSVPIAVVNNAAYQQDAAFQSALYSVSDDNEAAESKLFHVTLATEQQAEDSLESNDIKGYITVDGGIHVTVRDSDVGQTILKEFVDSYLQTSSAFTSITSQNPTAAQHFQAPSDVSYLREAGPGKANPDGTMTYFYSVIAMAALFGGFWGNKEITDIQADLSAQGARANLAPVHKLKTLVYSLCAAVLVHFLSLVLLVAYMDLVLKISFGGQLPYVLIACLAGSLTGVTYGAMIGALTAKNEHLKAAVLVTLSMVLSFLSGLMISTVKYTVAHAVPLISYINPANLIADAFYSLYYYSTYTRFFTNIGILTALSAVFCLVVYFVTRRQKYASL